MPSYDVVKANMETAVTNGQPSGVYKQIQSRGLYLMMCHVLPAEKKDELVELRRNWISAIKFKYDVLPVSQEASRIWRTREGKLAFIQMKPGTIPVPRRWLKEFIYPLPDPELTSSSSMLS